MSQAEPDVIDLLAGIEKGSRLDRVRAQRQQARDNAQKSYQALFAPRFPGGVNAEERYAVAAFVAGLHRDPKALAFYMDGLAVHAGRGDIAEAIRDEVARGATQGPYGRYRRGPLTVEDQAGPVHKISDANRQILGARLSAALEHAHLLVFHARDASPAALQSLRDAGWLTDDIVTLSQLVAFLSFQIRAIEGLRVLAAAPAGDD